MDLHPSPAAHLTMGVTLSLRERPFDRDIFSFWTAVVCDRAYSGQEAFFRRVVIIYAQQIAASGDSL
jgi:hypothetical protein